MKKLIYLFIIPVLILYCGYVILLHLSMTNLIDDEIVVEFQIPIASKSNNYYSRTFNSYLIVISNYIEPKFANDLKYIDFDKIKQHLDKAIDTIKLKRLDIKYGDIVWYFDKNKTETDYLFRMYNT